VRVRGAHVCWCSIGSRRCGCVYLPESCLDSHSPLWHALHLAFHCWCLTSFPLCHDSLASVVASHPIEEKDWWVAKEEELDLASSQPPLCSSSTRHEQTTDPSQEILFHNRGYEVWEHCRQAWRRRHHASSSEQPAVTSSSSSGRSPLRSPLRRKLMSGLVQKKQYTLPRNLGLGEMVQVYQEIWHGDSSD
jgi:hypothetical protein